MIKECFLQALAIAAVVSVVLAVLLFPARRWLERRYAPQVRWLLWRGIAFVLILGIGGFSAFHMVPAVLVFRLPNRTFDVPVPQEEVGRSGNVLRPENVGFSRSAMSPKNAGTSEGVKYPADMMLDSNVESDLTAAPDKLSTPMDGKAPKGHRVSLLELLGWLWLAVAMLLALRQTLACLLTRRRMLRASVPAEHADAWQGANGRIRFRILPELETPMTLGWIRPTVFLRQEDTAAMAVFHEMAHVRRRDILYKNVIFIACALYWFDPLVWFMAKAADRDMEAACDADVVKSCTFEERRSYGELLIAAAAGGKAVPFATRFGDSREEMKFRLTQLMRPGKGSRALVCVLLAAILAVTPFVTCVGTVTEAEAKPALEAETDGGAESAGVKAATKTGIEKKKEIETAGIEIKKETETEAGIEIKKETETETETEAGIGTGIETWTGIEKETGTEIKTGLKTEPGGGQLTIPETERPSAEDFVIKDGILERYVGAGGDIVIPEGVTGIGPRAFGGCTGLTSIVLPAGIESIGMAAFKDCTGLTRADIAGGFQHKYDGEAAFYGCTGLKSVTIRSGWYLPAHIFGGCVSLESVALPSELERIYEGAFRDCQSLKSVELPSGLELIDEEAFAGSGLTSIAIPSNVTEIRYRAFAGCVNLTVRIPKTWEGSDGVQIQKERGK